MFVTLILKGKTVSEPLYGVMKEEGTAKNSILSFRYLITMFPNSVLPLFLSAPFIISLTRPLLTLSLFPREESALNIAFSLFQG